MTHTMTYLECGWLGSATYAVMGQISGIPTEYSKPYAITIIAVSGIGLLLSRVVDAYLKYKKGMQGTSQGKLENCTHELLIQKDRYEVALAFKDREYAMLTSSHEQLKALVISQQEIIKKFEK